MGYKIMMNRDMKKKIRNQITMELRKEQPNMELIKELYVKIGVIFDGGKTRPRGKRNPKYIPVDMTVPQYFDMKNAGFKDNDIAKMFGIERSKLWRWKCEHEIDRLNMIHFDVHYYTFLRSQKKTLNQIAEEFGCDRKTLFYHRKKYGLISDRDLKRKEWR
jgi:hypothetical protein